MTGYYDVVLGLIPVSLLVIAGALSLVGVGTTTAVSLAATVPVALIGHAMFVNAPVDDPATHTQSSPLQAAD